MKKPKIGQVIIYKGLPAIIVKITKLEIYLSTGDMILMSEWLEEQE